MRGSEIEFDLPPGDLARVHLGELRQQHDLTIAWTTHLMDEAEHADRLAILSSGQLLTVSSPDELKASLGSHIVTAQPMHLEDLDALRDQIDAELGPWEPGKAPVVIQEEVRFEHEDGPAIVAQIAQRLPGQLRRISVGQPTLEDAYLHLTAQR